MRIAGGDSGVNHLTPGEATGSMTINETVVDRPWDFWKARAKVVLAGLARWQRLIDQVTSHAVIPRRRGIQTEAVARCSMTLP